MSITLVAHLMKRQPTICTSYVHLYIIFLIQEVFIIENVSYVNHSSRIQLLNGCKLAINWKKKTMMQQFANNLTLMCFSCKFNYWFKFHVNGMTGSGVKTLFLYKWMTRKIKSTLAWVLPNIWRLGEVVIPNVEQMFLRKSYWILQRKTNRGVNLRD